MTKNNSQNESWIVCLSTFPPRQCGIATFTTDLTNGIERAFGPTVKTKIVAMNLSNVSRLKYPDKVIMQISQPRESDYVDVALKLNLIPEIKLVSIQHEFGIFGGKYGSFLLLFLEKLEKPVIVTMHTVLPNPDKKRLEVVQSIMKHAKGIIVMTEASRKILIKDYKLNPKKIHIVPHGIHHVPYRTSARAKSEFGHTGKTVLGTFGFLSSGKGAEYVIRALPEVVKKFPEARFLIAGVTHPTVMEQEGETYRKSLINEVNELGLSEHVSFYNNYFDIKKLLQFLEATDIYLSTSLSPNQAVSGTLSYALGSGRPVISTAFSQAKQDISPEVGLLVDFKNPPEFTKAIIKLLGDSQLSQKMGKTAYFRTRHMTWENVAHSYMKHFAGSAPDLIKRQRRLPPVKLTHLANMTDDFGMIQFARLTKPDISSGYTVDDNARAMMVAATHYNKFGIKSSLKLVSTYLKFLYFVSKKNGHFDNYVDANSVIDEQRNITEYSEDPSARTLYALAQISTTKKIPAKIRQKAHSLFDYSFKKRITFFAPRPSAFYIKALASMLSRSQDPKILNELKQYCEKLIILYQKNHTPEWEWYEPYLTYSNALLPEALILGYEITGKEKYLEVAETTLKFLINQTFKDGIYMPVGQCGWFPKEGVRQYFDQQPEDTATNIQALNSMYRVTKNEEYKKLANKAFNWFLGDNILGQVVYDRTTGGCYDGIGEKFINLNQGAESTISYLISRLSFED